MRLADRVFAPHYAAHLVHVATRATPIRVGRDAEAEILTTLNPGDLFEVLELSAGLAWGSAPAHHLVGYVAAADLGLPA